MGEQGALGIGEMGNDEVGNGDVGNGDMGNDEVGNGYVGNGHDLVFLITLLDGIYFLLILANKSCSNQAPHQIGNIE